jgi:hypothetical protein
LSRGKKKPIFNIVSLPCATVIQWAEDNSELLNQLRNKARKSERFCLSLDEFHGTNDNVQLLIVIQGIKESFLRWSKNSLVLRACMVQQQWKICVCNHEGTCG